MLMQAEGGRYSDFFSLSHQGPPPKSPSNREWLEAFPCPTYDATMANAEQGDTMRLPKYTERQLNRFHPYFPPKLVKELKKEGAEYQNTIWDEQYIPLEVPARVGPPPPTPALLPYGLAEFILDEELDDDEEMLELDEEEHARRLRAFEAERWARIHRLHIAVLDFVRTLRNGNATTDPRRVPVLFRDYTIQRLLDVTNQLSPPEDMEEISQAPTPENDVVEMENAI